MSQIRSIKRRNRRIAGAVGVGVVAATAAVAVPTFAAQADNETASESAAPSTTAPAPQLETTSAAAPSVESLTADQQAYFRYFTASDEEKRAFIWMLMTPEQQVAFTFFTMSDEQRAAFNAMFAPAPIVQQTTTVPTYVPPTAPQAPAKVKVTTPAPKPVAKPQTTARTTARSSGGSAPNGFLACVRNRESRGQYTVVNRSSGAAGAYQFMPSTARAVANHAGRSDLAGRPVTSWSPRDQDAMAAHLYSWQGASPWAGPGC